VGAGPGPRTLAIRDILRRLPYERVHERTKSDVKGLADLRDTVARWSAQTKHTFTLDEIESVVQYLNESHYRFGLPPGSTPRKRPAP
jgi:hypothetical protein